MYDTDSVEPFVTTIGRLTFQVEVTHAKIVITANSAGCDTVRGATAPSRRAPPTTTPATYRRAPSGIDRHVGRPLPGEPGCGLRASEPVSVAVI